jgi:ubiquinone/menaquinone biosynthesis C-methylase UbiE
MERTLSKLITYPVNGNIADALPSTIAGRTRRVYDALSLVYPMSTFFFHSKAHEYALEASGIRDGMRVLEVATGSGEMFHRLVAANPNGCTIGLDLSPNMAARTQRIVRRKFPDSRTQCEAVDARYMPFRDESFDAVMCCYLLELLSGDDIVVALQEIYRVLRRRGTFTLVLIGQNTEFFNQAYRVCGSLAPAFWGRQVAQRIPELIESLDFRITGDKALRQGFYPSRILTARR